MDAKYIRIIMRVQLANKKGGAEAVSKLVKSQYVINGINHIDTSDLSFDEKVAKMLVTTVEEYDGIIPTQPSVPSNNPTSAPVPVPTPAPVVDPVLPNNDIDTDHLSKAERRKIKKIESIRRQLPNADNLDDILANFED
jgi:hypothetical protein